MLTRNSVLLAQRSTGPSQLPILLLLGALGWAVVALLGYGMWQLLGLIAHAVRGL